MRAVVLCVIFLLLAGSATADIVPELEDELDSLDEDDLVEVLVSLDLEPDSSGVLTESNFSAMDVEIEEEYEEFNIVLMVLSVSDVENVSEEEFVDRVEPDYEIEALLAESSIQIGSRISWRADVTGENVSLAVMDSGIAEHQRLNLAGQRDFTGEGTGDYNGHGTHVAGIIGSTHPDYRGVAYDADLYDVKVLDAEGKGQGSNMLRGLDYVIRNEMDVAVMSLGTTVDNCGGNDALSRAVGEAVRSGVVVAASAGNSGPGNSTLTAPGCSERALTVGAVDKSDSIATYSSRGLTSDERVKPDVVAPGSSIISTGRSDNFVSMSGTSMAAPQVAGQAALILSENPGKTPAEVKASVMESADDLGYSENIQGAGRINVPESLNSTVELQSVRERPNMLVRFWLWIASIF